MTKAEAVLKKYEHAPYNPIKCVESVRDDGRWPSFHQCRRANGHGPEGLYCKAHNPEAVAQRDKERTEKWERERKAEAPKWFAHSMFALLKESVNGITPEWEKRRDKILKDIDRA